MQVLRLSLARKKNAPNIAQDDNAFLMRTLETGHYARMPWTLSQFAADAARDEWSGTPVTL
jgi:hypothetical protein